MNLTRPWWELWVYGRPETNPPTMSLITPANTNFQLLRIPYPNPDNAKTTLLCIHISNPNTTTPALVKIWDQDLTDLSSNTQAANRGSISTPVIQFNVPAGGDVIAETMTRPYFQGGIACQSTINNTFCSVYVVHQGLG